MHRDKRIGILSLAAISLFIAYIAFAVWQNEKKARNIVFVQFSEMGALQNQDVVSIRGLTVGHILSITRTNEKALVKIELYEPRVFRKNTKFRNVSPNIMGSRSIVIEPSEEGEFTPEDYVFDGEFEPGLAEVLALTDVAKEYVASVMKFVRILYAGDEKSRPLQKTFEDIMHECEDLLATLSDVVNSVEDQALGALNKISDYAGQISDASIKINNSLDTIRIQAQDGIKSAENIILKINSSIENLNEILVQLENNPVMEALLDKREIIDDIDSLRSAIQAFVGSIDRYGVKIYDENGERQSMIRLRNLHPFRETARSKAKK